MKTIYLMLIGCFISFAGIAQSPEEIQKQMIKVGELHNQGLDVIYEQLQTQASEFGKAATTDEKIKFLTGIINSTPPYNPVPSSIAQAIHSEALTNNTNSFKRQLESKGGETIAQTTLASLPLSRKETEYYNQFQSILEKNESNMPALSMALQNFINNVIATFGPNSNFTIAMIAGAEVSKASAAYWQRNTEKWLELGTALGGKNSTGRAAPCCGGVVSADGAGAISGAVTGAVAGAAAVGVGALPGAVTGAVTGALTSSTVAAVSHLIGWLFN